MENLQKLTVTQMAIWCYIGIVVVVSLLILARLYLSLYHLFMKVIDMVFDVKHDKKRLHYSIPEYLTQLVSACLALLCCGMVGVGEAACIVFGWSDGGPVVVGVIVGLISFLTIVTCTDPRISHDKE